jgi:hypothetical protein
MVFNLWAQYIVFLGKNNRYFRQKKTAKKSFYRYLFFKVWVFLAGILALKKMPFGLFWMP